MSKSKSSNDIYASEDKFPPIEKVISDDPIHQIKEESPNPFNPEKFHIKQDFQSALGVKKLLLTIPVRKPSKEWFFRCHDDPNYQIQTIILELKEDSEIYLVDPSLWELLIGEATCSTRLLIPSINKQGVIFLWPVRLPGPDGRQDSWSRSAMEAANYAKNKWVRIQPNMSLGAYDVCMAPTETVPPNWGELPSLNEIFRLAFKDHFIDTADHPVLKRLRGEI